jgi:hypothetical protein
MPLLLRLFVALLAAISLLAARHLHQRAAPVGLVAPPIHAPAEHKQCLTNQLKNTRQVTQPASTMSSTQLPFLRSL